MSLNLGDKAPDFKISTDGGGECDLSLLAGRPVVLYFYPKDNTPGCTKEACEFRDAMPDFSKCDAEIVGVSRDSVKKHDCFKAKHELNFSLIADEAGELCETYGVWVEKNLYGRKYMGIERATFLIDGKGVIREIWRKVRVKGHVDAVLAAVQGL
jgi:peroxiredoxin Q/BCP